MIFLDFLTIFLDFLTIFLDFLVEVRPEVRPRVPSGEVGGP